MKQLLDKHKILTLVLAGVAGGVAKEIQVGDTAPDAALVNATESFRLSSTDADLFAPRFPWEIG